MTIRKVNFVMGEYFHLYSRGVDKRIIFLDDSDERRFKRLLFLCNSTKPVVYKETKDKPLDKIIMGEKLVAIGAYCLMPNHFHLLVKEITEGGIVKFMRKLLTAYSSYFNKKYSRTGSLFSSEFKSRHLDTDNYLKYTFSYIHLNPVKLIDSHWREHEVDIQGVKDFLAKYKFSSYAEYDGIEREEKLILTKDAFPEYFTSIKEFDEEITSWLSFNEPEHLQALSLDTVNGLKPSSI